MMNDWVRPLKVLAKKKKPFWFIKKGWNSIELLFETTRLPLVTRLHPWFRSDRNDARWLPINQDLELPDSVKPDGVRSCVVRLLKLGVTSCVVL